MESSDVVPGAGLELNPIPENKEVPSNQSSSSRQNRQTGKGVARN